MSSEIIYDFNVGIEITASGLQQLK